MKSVKELLKRPVEAKTKARPEAEGQICCAQPRTAAPTCSADKTQQIRKKAYEIYEKKGRRQGHDQEDWFEAEQTCGMD